MKKKKTTHKPITEEKKCSYSVTWHCSYYSKFGEKKSGSRNQSPVATL